MWTFETFHIAMLSTVLGVGAYFAPTIIAGLRRKKNAVAIFLLNLLLGWTIIGWIVALIWSVTHESRD